MEGDEVADERASAAVAVVGVREEDPYVPSSSSAAINPGETQPSAVAAAVPAEILRALEVVERDSAAIAESYASLFSSLRLSLSEVTRTSLENMQCFNDVVGRLQESALDAATKGSRYINSCLRLNEEMKDLESVAIQLYPSSFHPFYIKQSFDQDFEEECGLFGPSCQPNNATSMIGELLHAFEDCL